jgi:hypothetical protein
MESPLFSERIIYSYERSGVPPPSPYASPDELILDRLRKRRLYWDSAANNASAFGLRFSLPAFFGLTFLGNGDHGVSF